MESIYNQSPEGTTMEEIEVLFKKHGGRSADVLAELWDVDEVVKNKPYSNRDEQQKWENIRDICNTYEEEMQKLRSSMSAK